MSKHTLNTVAASLRDLADVLDLMTPTTAPSQQVRAQKAPEVAAKTTQKAPEGALACVSCAKPMLRVGATCKSCLRAAAKGERTVPAAQKASKSAKVAANIAPEAKANMGRRDAKAHCSHVGCGLFVPAGSNVCTKHATKSTTKAQGQFITLDDGKRGFRVPADLVLALRKAGVDDATIIAAAKAKGLGHKLPKAKGTLV